MTERGDRPPPQVGHTTGPPGGAPGGPGRVTRQAVAEPWWRRLWSRQALVRAVRAAVLVPAVFAFCLLVLRLPQVATFAAFGGFASLVLASFGGTRRDRAVAHLMLTAAGAALIVIGTLVSSSVVAATVATALVAFTSYFAAVIGPNDASGAAAAMLPYMLAASAAAPAHVIGPRVSGWVLATVVGGIAVVLTAPRSAGRELRQATATLASGLADLLEAGGRRAALPELRAAVSGATHQMMALFVSAPYRPSGLVIADQAMAGAVSQLEWCKGLVADGIERCGDLRDAPPTQRAPLEASARVLRQAAAVLRGEAVDPDLVALEQARVDSVAQLTRPGRGEADDMELVVAFYGQTTATCVHSFATDVLIATRGADPLTAGSSLRRWYGLARPDRPPLARLVTLAGVAGIVLRNANLRSVWFVNALRGALALSVAVMIVQLSDVRSGFWVLLGALSVLRTSAASTGTMAVKAILGTAAGVAVGAALLPALGRSPEAHWAALVVAVFVVAYAPGVLPDVAGQAAFTVVILVLYNILAPTGWTLGLIRLQDVVIGCSVSLVAGLLVWPRGAGDLVRDDVAELFRDGGVRLSEAVSWSLGLRPIPPAPAQRAAGAGFRLEDALRGYLAEPGSKRMNRQDLWRLVIAGVRLRLTADALDDLTPRDASPDPNCDALVRHADALAAFYASLADQLGRPTGPMPPPLTPPAPDRSEVSGALPGGTAPQRLRRRWVGEHLRHLELHLADLVVPAQALAVQRRRPWWR
ncbi:FUSC family protein [Catellatospora sp. IY07-71]|uniref:FUSC family protein n=1 Tax=Catellatospora sp. IY07-71 TaxID=2728827 RepID=UPI001BB3A195|nr:FUSC family protein [Catellatospora sp. IY07-71]BCJ74532.1 FUSC family protein [Catellatospora sp. IY07-71]